MSSDIQIKPSETQFGAFLRNQRRRSRISLEEVAHATRIPLVMLERLEAEDWEQLPEPVFLRGYVRSYARSIGVCESDALRRLEEADTRGVKPLAPIASVREHLSGDRLGTRLAVLTLVAVFCAALTWVFRPQSDVVVMTAPRRAMPGVTLERAQGKEREPKEAWRSEQKAKPSVSAPWTTETPTASLPR